MVPMDKEKRIAILTAVAAFLSLASGKKSARKKPRTTAMINVWRIAGRKDMIDSDICVF